MQDNTMTITTRPASSAFVLGKAILKTVARIAVLTLVLYLAVSYAGAHKGAVQDSKVRQASVEKSIASAETSAFTQNEIAQKRYVQMMAASPTVQTALAVAAESCPLADGDPRT